MTQQIVFWQNIPSIHQSALIRNLSNCSDYHFTLICEQDISADRRSMGWQMPDYGKTDVIIAPKERMIKDLIFSRSVPKTHVFAGTRSYPLVKDALRKSLETDATIGVYSEIPDHPYGACSVSLKEFCTALMP